MNLFNYILNPTSNNGYKLYRNLFKFLNFKQERPYNNIYLIYFPDSLLSLAKIAPSIPTKFIDLPKNPWKT